MKRIIPGLVLAAGWLLLLLGGSFFYFWLVIIAVAVVGGYEYVRMTFGDAQGLVDSLVLTLFLILPVLFAGNVQSGGLGGGLFLSFFFISLYVVFRYKALNDPYTYFIKLAFGSLYVGFLLAHLLLLWFLPEGNYWLILLAAITAGSDTGAYYFGSYLGKHKLCPAISPKKTVEGALGGVVCGGGIALIASYFLFGSFNVSVVLPVAALLVFAGIIGDLSESVLKRGTNTKDSGKLLLGHGGILDRVDSMLIAAPFLYYLHIFTGG